MGLFSNPSNSDDLEIRVARLEAQVAALMPLLDIDQTPTTWQQQAAPAPAIGPTLPVVDADVARILARGNKIEAIKLARDKYGLGLKEAKDYVEGMPDLR
jgi:ribosomal protein L7/L12